MTNMMQDILKLSIAERIMMVEAIWDSIAEDQDKVELSSETKELLNGRLEAHKKDPEEGSGWDEVKARIKNQF